MFIPISALFAFAFGAIIGSFLNVVIYRVPIGQSVVSPPSRCTTCQSRIRWYDNIPILSWLMLGGECRTCSTKISPRYALVEGLMGVLSALLWLKFVTPMVAQAHHWSLIDPQRLVVPFGLYFVFVALCVVIAFIDLDHFIIPHELAIPGILIGLASPWVIGALFTTEELITLWPPITPGVSLAGALAGAFSIIAIFLLYLMLRGVAGMGGGDVTLMAMVGAWLGWPALIFVFFAASVQGLLAAGITTALGINFVKDARDILDDEPERDDVIVVKARDTTPSKNAAAESTASAKTPDDTAIANETSDKSETEAQTPEEAAPTQDVADAATEAAEGETKQEVKTTIEVTAEEEEDGPMAIPFGPFIVLAALEHLFLGPFLPESMSMIYMYIF